VVRAADSIVAEGINEEGGTGQIDTCDGQPPKILASTAAYWLGAGRIAE
jgi:hypothetical protein